MARRGRSQGNRGVMEILLDPLFGLVGALLVVFIMQIVSTINMVDRNLVEKIEDLALKNQRLAQVEREFQAQDMVVDSLQEEMAAFQERILESESAMLRWKREAAEQQARADQLEMAQGAPVDESLRREIEQARRELETLRAESGGPVPGLPLTIETLQIPPAIMQTPYCLTFAASGGNPPYRWQVTGDLPEGLRFDEAAGTLRGSAARIGSGEIHVGLLDSQGLEVGRDLDMQVKTAGGMVGERSWKERIPTLLFVVAGLLIAWQFISFIRRFLAMQRYKEMIRKGFKPAWVK